MSGIENKCSESRGRSNHLESDLSHFPSNLPHQSPHPPTYLLWEVITENENRLSAYSELADDGPRDEHPVGLRPLPLIY